MKTPGAWTTKATDQFTLKLAIADATAACTRAGEDTKGWKIEETEPESHRILLKRGPGFVDQVTFHVEVSLTDAGGGGTTVAFNGWRFGKGPGGKGSVKKAISEVRTAIEAQALSS